MRFLQRAFVTIESMAVDVRTLPPQVARAAECAREVVGILLVGPPAIEPVEPELVAFAEWALASGELAAALQRVGESDRDLAD